eukprot:14691_1
MSDCPGTDEKYCEAWVDYTKAEILKTDESKNRQRLLVTQIAGNLAISLTFKHFELRPLTNNLLIVLDCNDIIRGIIHKWNETKLLKWRGVQDRNGLLSTIQWEGKKGYWNRSRNNLHQDMHKVSDALWVRVFEHSKVQIDNISVAQFPQNDELQRAFASCLRYTHLYSLCVAEISFFHCKAKPLIIDTALTKNPKIRRYLHTMDPQITISEWEDEEADLATKQDKICARVRRRIVQYLETALLREFRMFHSLLVEFRLMHSWKSNGTTIDFNAFKVNTKFDKQGKAKEFSDFDPTPYISNAHFTTAFYSKNAPKPVTKVTKPTKTKRKTSNTNPTNNIVESRSITTRMNHNYDGSHREFQRVSYGMERRNVFVDRGTRQRNVEANIQQRHQDYMMNIANDGYHAVNQVSEVEALRSENQMLRCQKQYLLHELERWNQQTLPPVVPHPFSVNPIGLGYDMSMGSVSSGSMGSVSSGSPHCSPQMPMDYVPYVPVHHHVVPMDDNVCSNPWREW